MEKSSVISTKQLIGIMIFTRVAFSTAYYSSLNAGNHIQDVLLAAPIDLVLCLLVAIPMILLLKRHPGKGFLECSHQIVGKAATVFLVLLYSAFYLTQAISLLGNFQLYYLNGVISNTKSYAISIPILLVCIYGAVKGIETIARFSGIGLTIYFIIISTIVLSLIGVMNLGYLKPLLADGTQYVQKSAVFGFNGSAQLVIFASCTQFLKPGTKIGKTYVQWTVIVWLVLAFTEFVTIAVMGPYASKQVFPLYTLSQLSQFGVFERMDAFHMAAWIMESVMGITIYIYLVMNAFTKIGVQKFRTPIAFICAIIMMFAAPFVTENNVQFLRISGSILFMLLVLLLLFVIPLLILIIDIIKGKVSNNEGEEAKDTGHDAA